MDRWSQLSMSEKSDLMSLYIQNGISSLEEIKKHYNSFTTGGQMNTDGPDEPPQDQTITVANPLFTTKGTLSQENADWDLGNQYTFKDTMRGIGLAGDYFSSEGFRNRANIANEKYGYLYNIEKPLRRTIPQQAAFIRGDNNANAAFKFGLNNSLDPIFVGAHETGHHNPVFNNYTFGMTTEEKAELSNPESTLYSPLYRNDYRSIPEDWRNILRNENPINDHDAELSEAYSDLVGLRALLKAYGIFDSTDPNAKFTQEMLDAFRKKLGNKGNRFLDYHSDENVIKAINEIAQNNTTEDTVHYAALGGKLGKVTPYGQWQYPHQVTTIPSNNITMKGVNYPVVGVSNTGDTKVMLPNKNYEFDGEYVTEYPIHNFQKGGKLTRVRRNDSPTQASSESMEDRTAQHIQRFNADKIDHSYDIPYIPEKEIVVPGVGRVSTNALDSIAKYSYLAGIPLEEGLGLAAQESAFGAMPFLNYNKIPDSLPQKEKDRRAAANRALGNTSYFRNYGSIPANYLVRDWHYFDLTDEQREATPPLLDAFRYWKAGKYNTNDKSHTEDVRTKGRQVIKTTPIRAWMQSSKYVKKATTKKKK